MCATKEQMRAEAVKRIGILEKMGLHPNVRRDFADGELVNYSERAAFGPLDCGILFWATNDTAVSRAGVKFADVIAAFEKEFGAVVYHATHEFTNFGELLDLFYVSRHDEEWERDRIDLELKRPFVYARNLDDGILSDLGCIGIEVSGGGVIRTA